MTINIPLELNRPRINAPICLDPIGKTVALAGNADAKTRFEDCYIILFDDKTYTVITNNDDGDIIANDYPQPISNYVSADTLYKTGFITKKLYREYSEWEDQIVEQRLKIRRENLIDELARLDAA